MAPLLLSRTCYHSPSTHSNLTQELCSSEAVQLNRPSSQQETGRKTSGKVLLDAELYRLKHAPAASELAISLYKTWLCSTELVAKLQIKASLHPDCTWLMRATQPRM